MSLNFAHIDRRAATVEDVIAPLCIQEIEAASCTHFTCQCLPLSCNFGQVVTQVLNADWCFNALNLELVRTATTSVYRGMVLSHPSTHCKALFL